MVPTSNYPSNFLSAKLTFTAYAAYSGTDLGDDYQGGMGLTRVQGTSSFRYLGSEASLIFTLFNLKNLPLVVETLSLDYKKNPITAKNSKYFLNLLNGTNILQNSPNGWKILLNLPNDSKILDGVAPPANTSMSVLPFFEEFPLGGNLDFLEGELEATISDEK